MRDVDARSALVQGAGFSAASLCRIAHLILRLVGRGIVSNTLVLVHGASLGTARVVIDSSQHTGRASAYAHPPPASSESTERGADAGNFLGVWSPAGRAGVQLAGPPAALLVQVQGSMSPMHQLQARPDALYAGKNPHNE